MLLVEPMEFTSRSWEGTESCSDALFRGSVSIFWFRHEASCAPEGSEGWSAAATPLLVGCPPSGSFSRSATWAMSERVRVTTPTSSGGAAVLTESKQLHHWGTLRRMVPCTSEDSLM